MRYLIIIGIIAFLAAVPAFDYEIIERPYDDGVSQPCIFNSCWLYCTQSYMHRFRDAFCRDPSCWCKIVTG